MHGTNLGRPGYNASQGPLKDRHDATLYILVSEILQNTGLKYRFEDNKSFEHTRATQNRRGTIVPDLSIFIDGSWRFYDLKIMTHGTALFRAPYREGAAFPCRQRAVNSQYFRHAEALDTEMGDTRCVDLLRNHGRVRGLVADTRGAISEDFTDLINMCAKSAAEKHWDEMGAASQHLAKQTYLQLFRRTIGVTLVREGAKWMRKALAHFIDRRNGVPRGENARTYSRMRTIQREHRRDYLDCFYHSRSQYNPHSA